MQAGRPGRRPFRGSGDRCPAHGVLGTPDPSQHCAFPTCYTLMRLTTLSWSWVAHLGWSGPQASPLPTTQAHHGRPLQFLTAVNKEGDQDSGTFWFLPVPMLLDMHSFLPAVIAGEKPLYSLCLGWIFLNKIEQNRKRPHIDWGRIQKKWKSGSRMKGYS